MTWNRKLLMYALFGRLVNFKDIVSVNAFLSESNKLQICKIILYYVYESSVTYVRDTKFKNLTMFLNGNKRLQKEKLTCRISVGIQDEESIQYHWEKKNGPIFA